MKDHRENRQAVALKECTQAYDRMNASFEALPNELRQQLSSQIEQQVARDLAGQEFSTVRNHEVALMTKALVCAGFQGSSELRETSQTFLRSRLSYLNLGGKYGRLGRHS